ncbi:MAG: glycosyltransferase family 4 protein [Lachnospiraceae bacterium]
MKRVCIITIGEYPIPDVKGGAVERLITMIAEDNEQNPRFEFTILTCKNNEAIEHQKRFCHTKFVNIPAYAGNRVVFWSRRFHNLFNHRLHIPTDVTWIKWLMSPFNRYVFKHRNQFDMFVTEGATTDFCCTASRYVARNKMTMHLHVNTIANKLFENTFGNVVAVSDFIMNQYREKSSLPTNRTATIFNGIATENFIKQISCEEKISLRKKLGLAQEDFVVIFCGRIAKTKGVKEAITAITSIENKNIKLLIMGASKFGKGNFGDYAQEIDELVSRNSDRVIFTGYVNNHELYKYHKIADVGIIPSTYNDPCPLSMFELITSGLPTIATYAGGMTEIGTQETTIYITIENMVEDIKKSVLMLYENINLRQKMSVAATKRADYFNRRRFFNDFCDTIDRFIVQNETKK